MPPVGKSRESGMTAKQEMFISEYLVDFNGKRAAEAAGYKSPNEMAHFILNTDRFPVVKAKIREEIIKRKRELEGLLGSSAITVVEVIAELGKIGLFNPKRLLDEDGYMLDLQDLPDEVAACIKEFKVSYREIEEVEVGEENDERSRDGRKRARARGKVKERSHLKVMEVKFWDKLEALAQIAKHLGLFKDQNTFNLNVVNLNWAELYDSYSKPNPIAQRLIQEEKEKEEEIMDAENVDIHSTVPIPEDFK